MTNTIIQSKQNPQLKEWKKLLTAKGRKKSQSYLIEGTHLAEEAIKWNVPVKQWMMTENYYHNEWAKIKGEKPENDIILLADNIAKEISMTEATQGIFAEVRINSADFKDLSVKKRYLLIDAVQDPGNLGTMIRTADAAGYDAVIVGEGSVDIYNDKVIRSSQGSIWHLPVMNYSLNEAMETLHKHNVKIFATHLNQTAESYLNIIPPQSLGIIVGNEGSGVRTRHIQAADQSIYIPMPGHAESLNVGVAAGILMFHFVQME